MQISLKKYSGYLIIGSVIVVILLLLFFVSSLYKPKIIVSNWELDKSIRPYFDRLSGEEAKDKVIGYCKALGMECNIVNITKVGGVYSARVYNTLDNHHYLFFISSYNGGLLLVSDIDTIASSLGQNTTCKPSNDLLAKVKQELLEKLHSVGYGMITDLELLSKKTLGLTRIEYKVEIKGNKLYPGITVSTLIDPCTGKIVDFRVDDTISFFLNIKVDDIIDYQTAKNILDKYLKSKGIENYRVSKEGLAIAIAAKIGDIEPIPIWKFYIEYYREGMFYEDETIVINAYTGEIIQAK